jgi:hypothetical protein
LDDFYVRAKNRDIRQSWCKRCTNKYAVAWRLDPENKKKQFEYNHTALALASRSDSGRKRYAKLKQVVFQHYAINNVIQCSCCGEKMLGFLTIDHVNNDGAVHRKTVKSGVVFYCWLKNNGFPAGFQILCYNCNCGRAKNHGICPHKDGGVCIPEK